MDELESAVRRGESIRFEAAERYFGEKLPVTASQFYKLSEKYQSIAFTVSNYSKASVLKKFQERLLAALADGTTLETFRQDMNDFLTAEGYKGVTRFQAENIFRTNVQTAYSVGHFEQMTAPAVLKLRPYWQYDAVEDKHTRPSHLAMDGKVFPADSPIWDTWYPPNGFKCRCTVRSLSKRQVEERGLKVQTDLPRVDQLADGRFVSLMPDPHFGTNPAKARFTPDLTDYPEPLVKAYQSAQKAGPVG